MADLTRYTQKLFGTSAGANEMAEYGSLIGSPPGNLYSGSTITPAIVQQLSQFQGGLYAAVSGAYSPTIQDINSLFFLLNYQVAYGLQKGIPDWDSGTTYYIGDIVKDSIGNLYTSLINNNLNNAITNITDWKPILSPIANVAPNDSNVVFTASDNRTQFCTPTASRTYTMPTTSISKGDVWTFYNQSLYFCLVNASDSSQITFIPPNGKLVLVSNIATPISNSNWTIGDQHAGFNFTPVFSGGTGVLASGTITPGPWQCILDKNMVSFSGSLTVSGGSSDTTATGALSIPFLLGGSFAASTSANGTIVSTASPGWIGTLSAESSGSHLIFEAMAPSVGVSATWRFSGSYQIQ